MNTTIVLLEARIAALEILEAELAEYKASRCAYASEFQYNEDGEPDVDNIHKNIRELKAKNSALRAANTNMAAVINDLRGQLETFRKV